MYDPFIARSPIIQLTEMFAKVSLLITRVERIAIICHSSLSSVSPPLMKLVGLESGPDARELLAQELGLNAGLPRSPDQNIALHDALMRELEKHGGAVPESIEDLLGKRLTHS